MNKIPKGKIPKGFKTYWVECKDNPYAECPEIALEKSIYDKRKEMKKDVIRNCKNINSITRNIILTDFEEIDDGDFDGMEL